MNLNLSILDLLWNYINWTCGSGKNLSIKEQLPILIPVSVCGIWVMSADQFQGSLLTTAFAAMATISVSSSSIYHNNSLALSCITIFIITVVHHHLPSWWSHHQYHHIFIVLMVITTLIITAVITVIIIMITAVLWWGVSAYWTSQWSAIALAPYSTQKNKAKKQKHLHC